MSILLLNGTDVSGYIQKLDISHEPIWSEGTGRTIDATFTGDIVGWKWKLSVATKPLSQAESASIMTILRNNAFVTVKFVDPEDSSGALVQISAYSSAPKTGAYSYHSNLSSIRYKSLSFDLIER